jgi:hypothetical protein
MTILNVNISEEGSRSKGFLIGTCFGVTAVLYIKEKEQGKLNSRERPDEKQTHQDKN